MGTFLFAFGRGADGVNGSAARGVAQAYRDRLGAVGGVRMVAQPIIDLHNGELVKAEVLARLVMRDGVVVPPGGFLPHLGVVDVDRLFRASLDIALALLRRWESDGLVIGVSVNVSPSTLRDPAFAHWVEDALLRHRVNPKRLTLELLETHGVNASGQDAAIERMVQLGVQLAIDDLGSGFSGLQRLTALPFHAIKIDRGLLQRVRERPTQTLSVVRTVIQMARDFERETVVEGLEDFDLIEAVKFLGAHHGQGYALGRPMQAEQLPAWNRARVSLPRGERIRSTLGALAYHWRFTHEGHHVHPLPLAECPITRFLAERGLSAGEAAAWHEAVHSERDARDAARRLSAWLADQVNCERSLQAPAALAPSGVWSATP